MKPNVNWRRVLLICADVVLAVYLFMAFSSWNKTDGGRTICYKVTIDIADENENGFLSTAELKGLLERKGMYPLSLPLDRIKPREIEKQLKAMPFINDVQCSVTKDGHVRIIVTQRTPLIRVKSSLGEDYYVDDAGGIMPNSQYTSDMIIVTGDATKKYVCEYITILAGMLMDNALWRNQIEQINVLEDQSIELIPRVGDHIINIGVLPNTPDASKRRKAVEKFTSKQMHRLEIFYRFGLNHAGWTKYDYISLEYVNQVVCHRKKDAKYNEEEHFPQEVEEQNVLSE